MPVDVELLDAATPRCSTSSIGRARRRGCARPRARGHRAATGCDMLLEQGALAFERWFGIEPDRDAMWRRSRGERSRATSSARRDRRRASARSATARCGSAASPICCCRVRASPASAPLAASGARRSSAGSAGRVSRAPAPAVRALRPSAASVIAAAGATSCRRTCGRCARCCWVPGGRRAADRARAQVRRAGARPPTAWRRAWRGSRGRATSCAERTALVPVPLAAARQRERGFNQSELLARALAATGACRCGAMPSRARATRRRRRG